MKYITYLDKLETFIKKNNITIPVSSVLTPYEKNELNEKLSTDNKHSEDPKVCSVCDGRDFWRRPIEGDLACMKCFPPLLDLISGLNTDVA